MNQFDILDSRDARHIAHPSTKGAAAVVQGLVEAGFSPANMLDIGCGSGLLSLWMAARWSECAIIGSDISRLAIEEAQHNVAVNAPGARIELVVAAGLDHSRIEEQAPFDLIVANLLATWHVQYLNAMEQALAAHGFLVLSGILPWQITVLEEALSYTSLRVVQTVNVEQWMTLLLHRPSR